MRRPLRRFAVRLGVAVATISMVCTGATQLVSAAPKLVAIEVAPTAAISQTPTTVGVADSAMYFYTHEQIEQDAGRPPGDGRSERADHDPLGRGATVWSRLVLLGQRRRRSTPPLPETWACSACSKRLHGGQGPPSSTGSQIRRRSTRISRARWPNVTRARSRPTKSGMSRTEGNSSIRSAPPGTPSY